MRGSLPVDVLSRHVSYDPETGLITRIANMESDNRDRVGEIVGTRTDKSNGKLIFMSCGVLMQNHRAAWAIFYGHWPKKMILHKDGDKTNNKIDNLCERARKPIPLASEKVPKTQLLNTQDKSRLAARLLKGSMPEPNSGCWLWYGASNRTGYGLISIGGTHGYLYLASRASYYAFVGDIGDEACVLHKCDNPACMNPDHLFLGTKKDNARDMINKGRAAHPNCGKATTEEALKDMLSGAKTKDLAAKYGVSLPAISQARKRLLEI